MVMAKYSVLVPFRVSPEDALTLATAAKQHKLTRSDILRQLVRSLSKTALEEEIEPCQVC